MTSEATVFAVDDDPGIRKFIRNVAEKLGFEVGEAKTGKEYLDVFGETPAEAIVLDIAMPEKHGIGLFDFIQEHHRQSKIAIVTGNSDVFLDGAIRLGAEKGLNMIGGLNKPIKLDDLEKLLKDALPSSK